MKTRDQTPIEPLGVRCRKVCVIEVPYDFGRTGWRMAQGPGAYVRAGLLQRIAGDGYQVRTQPVRLALSSSNEIQACFQAARAVAQRVRQAVCDHEFPLILAGNCMNAVGVLGGLEGSARGVVWFDAHCDFNDPETTETGFLDGMALSVATGACWRELAASIPQFRPVPASSVLLLGARSIDAGERVALFASHVTVLPWSELQHGGRRATIGRAIEAFARHTRDVYLHVDMDVLDPRKARANELAPPGGFAVADLADAVTLVCNHLSVHAATFSGYSPGCDPERRTARAGLAVIQAVLAATINRQPASAPSGRALR